jgi:hypothetical protein
VDGATAGRLPRPVPQLTEQALALRLPVELGDVVGGEDLGQHPVHLVLLNVVAFSLGRASG